MAEVGRPSKYDESYCEIVVDLGKAGKSKAQMCAHFDISRQTIDNWAQQNPEFLEALSRATVHAQAWWEDKGVEGLTSREFNAPVWKKSMEARFREDYTERREDAVTHKADDSVSALMEAVNGRTRSK